MKKLVMLKNDQSGGMYILLVIFIFAIGILAVISYQNSLLHAIYQQAGRTIERAANVSVIVTKEDTKTRDLKFDIDYAAAKAAFEENLRNEGLTKISDGWVYKNEGKTVYKFDNIDVKTDGEVISVKGILRIPLVWKLGTELAETVMSVETSSTILYYLPSE
jgi:archaellum component FlaF (FlaF/FlaG flagellin family)